MQKLKAKVRQIIYRLRRDVMTAGNFSLVFLVILSIVFVYGAIGLMNRNWTLQQRLQARYVEKSKLELEVEMLKLEQAYIQSEEYQELMARTKQDLKLPGETMVILPENSEDALNRYKVEPAESSYRSNFDQWLDFLFG